MAQILTSLVTGFAAFELVYRVPTYGPLKGKITLQKIALRPSDTVTFLTDAQGTFKGLRQRTTFNGKLYDVGIPDERAFYVSCGEEERPYYGVSMFQSAFYHYDKKVRCYYLAHLASQRAAVGTRVGTLPPDASTQNKAAFGKALANLGAAQYIMLPGPEYKVDSLKDAGTYDFLGMINHHNSQMSKSVLAGFMDSSQGNGAADASLVDFSKNDDDMFMMMLRTLMDDIASAINNHLIPRFVRWNFGSDKFPKFKWGTLTDEQKAAVQTTFERLSTAANSLAVTPEFMFELEKTVAQEMNLPIDYDAVEARKAEEALAKASAPVIEAPGQPPVGAPPVPDGAAKPTLDSPDAVDSALADYFGSAQKSPDGKAAPTGKVKLSGGKRDIVDLTAEILERLGDGAYTV